MGEGLIGVMTSVPSLVAMAFMPLLGSLADRAPRKRTVLLFEHLLMAAACIALAPVIVLYIACQKFIISGIMLGGIKG